MDAVGLTPDGYLSDVEATNVDRGFERCRNGKNSSPTYGDGVVTPHGAFLAMMHDPRGAYQNLRKLRHEFDGYSAGGFFDAVAVGSGRVAERYLSLDQAMIMGALGNVLDRSRSGTGIVQRAFGQGAIERGIRPLIGMERFSAGS